MNRLNYTLVADGPSDRCLIHVINWAIIQLAPHRDILLINSQFADYREAPDVPRGLPARIRRAVRDFPCDILFVHRDAEGEGPERRREEIASATQEAGIPSTVCVIPVRMTEAWLLFNEAAIRRAAGNPHGLAPLRLPALQRMEREPDPKRVLREALEAASETSGRRLRHFQRDIPQLKQRVAELIEDFSPLQRLPAFRSFYEELQAELARRALVNLT